MSSLNKQRLNRAAMGFVAGFAGVGLAIRLYYILGLTQGALGWCVAIIAALIAVITTKAEEAQK